MKKQFKLQKVLEHRERVVDIEKNRLTDLKSAETQIENKITELDSTIELKCNEQQAFKIKGELAFVNMYDNYIMKLKIELLKTQQQLRQIRTKIEAQKKVVIKAMDEHKIMLKLKDRHVENYISYLNKEEMKMIDDLVVSRRGIGDE